MEKIKVSTMRTLFVFIVCGILSLTCKMDAIAAGITFEGKAIDKNSHISLYGIDDTKVADYWELKTEGYIIISVSGEIIEFSLSEPCFSINNEEEKHYYISPLEYYLETESSDLLEDVETGEICKKSSLRDEKVNIKGNSGKYPDGSTYNSIGYISCSETRTLKNSACLVDTNRANRGNCGSTAAAILMMYYYDNYSKKYMSASYRKKSNWQSFTNKLISYIEPNGGGSTYSKLKKGINSYLGSKGLSKTATYITDKNILTSYVSKYKSYIKNNKPCIVGLKKSTPTYGAHWVVGTGYKIYTCSKPDATTTAGVFFQVNDGWGKSNVYINKKYTDGIVYLK